MVQNFSNTPAAPHLFVYCGGEKAGAVLPPKLPPSFVAATPRVFGTMWRAADITTHVASPGAVPSCSVTLPVAPGGQTPYVTIDDASF